jgi:hypothetical protein
VDELTDQPEQLTTTRHEKLYELEVDQFLQPSDAVLVIVCRSDCCQVA